MIAKFKRTFGFILNHPVGSKYPVKAISKFILWQLKSGFSPNKFIVQPFISPVKFWAKKGLTGITGNIYTGLHEFNDMGFLLHFLRPNDAFFDIGANVGSYTLLASGVCGAASTAIEPVPSTFDILSRNIILNNLNDKVTLINAGAGAAAGQVKFSATEDTGNHVIAGDETGKIATVDVDIITIDSLLSGGSSPALIKVDVEGFETEVLRGMAATLKQATLKAIIIELNGSGGRYGFSELDIHQLLLDHGFKPYQYNPYERALSPLAGFGKYNTIYCRDVSYIAQRLQTALPFNIMGDSV